ncbi:c-type cytochrome [Neolewinella lacunae]|uniref:C-type cytochrome n=1 Tax=Neolewinella lacunae TaxID=1517758 RepID=A0A923T9B4_9BACT|nr:c-type cytochrome [Neolewinella lacunae]MBC6996550.1 c-type cytochrome [Neolewinella lacunae]MDN3634885.1 c-type cytochrome [Neolewinella lacunae]
MTYHQKFLPFLLLVFCLFAGGQTGIAQGDQDTATTAPAATLSASEAVADGEVAPGEGDYNKGKALWNANGCGSCHNRNMKDNSTGPALGGVESRWASEPREHLYRWVQNSQQLIASGESARAISVYNEWNKNPMTAFPALTNSDVEHLLGYIQGQIDGLGQVTGGPDGPVPAAAETDNTWLFIVLGLALLLLSLILARITSNMQYMVATKEQGDAPERRTLTDILTSKGMIAFVVFALVVLGGYTTVNHAIELGRQQDYQPEQPIKFSHVTHAGLNQIDCQYCHDGARRSKHSVIPAVNTCMNCHRAIKKGSQYGTAEITKIYAAIGYDPIEDVYIEDYENYTNEEAAEVYKKWIAQEYLADERDIDDLETTVDAQWEEIVSSLTDDYTGDTKVAGPVEWVRIHNLPDHAYFNHAQHVTVGNLQCQNCHGPVQEMELVYQYSPLSMGWCVNCHRQTEVQFNDNEYYQAYQRYHEEMKSGERTAVTVEDIGGLSCQRCHY